jgi:hypothetical protein
MLRRLATCLDTRGLALFRQRNREPALLALCWGRGRSRRKLHNAISLVVAVIAQIAAQAPARLRCGEPCGHL